MYLCIACLFVLFILLLAQTKYGLFKRDNSKTCRWLSFLSLLLRSHTTPVSIKPKQNQYWFLQHSFTLLLWVFVSSLSTMSGAIFVCVGFVYIYCVKITGMQMCTRRNKLKCVSLSRSLVCFQSASKQGLIDPGCSSSLEMTQRSEVGFSVSEVGMTNPHRRKSTEEYTLTERRRQRDTIKNDEWAPRAAEADDSSSGTKCCVLCKTLP